jgi:8-oxo-dGTP pyrophosphatase MutT (NUDIX family)
MNVRDDMVTVFVVRADESGKSHEFLQLHRAKEDYMGGTWQIIRGGVDADESYVTAGLREMREESGLTPSEFYRLDAVESFYTAVDDTLWHSVSFCAVVDRAQRVALNDEHDEYRWIARDEIARHTMWSSELQLLETLQRTILDNGPAKMFLRIDLPA